MTLHGIESDVTEMSEEQREKKLDRLRTTDSSHSPQSTRLKSKFLPYTQHASGAFFQKYARRWTINSNKVIYLETGVFIRVRKQDDEIDTTDDEPTQPISHQRHGDSWSRECSAQIPGTWLV
jgi:hypothetical protein